MFDLIIPLPDRANVVEKIRYLIGEESFSNRIGRITEATRVGIFVYKLYRKYMISQRPDLASSYTEKFLVEEADTFDDVYRNIVNQSIGEESFITDVEMYV